MVSDVQSWVDAPAGNHGWLLLGDETVLGAAKRFGSRESTFVNERPVLTIEYTPVPGPGVLGLVAGAGLMGLRRRR